MWRSWALVPREVPKLSVCVGSDQLGMGHFVGQLIPSLAGGVVVTLVAFTPCAASNGPFK